jgi:hypothetical protein
MRALADPRIPGREGLSDFARNRRLGPLYQRSQRGGNPGGYKGGREGRRARRHPEKSAEAGR